MDANKLTKLREVGYRIQPACGNCWSGMFKHIGTDWGSCFKHEYQHQKHVLDNPHRMSVHKTGCCDDHLFISTPELENFNEFIPKEIKR